MLNNKKLRRQEYHKIYYQKYKEKIKANKRKHYRENREKLEAKHKCECGGKYIYYNKSKHLNTKKHLFYMVEQIIYH